MLLPQHKDLGNEGRALSGFSEHQLNAETLGSISSKSGEFFLNWIIIKDFGGGGMGGKQFALRSTSRRACCIAGAD